MNRHSNRKLWLLRYRAQFKRVAATADALGIEANYLSSILGKNASRNLGDVAARKIELRMGLQPGALDLPPPDDSPSKPLIAAQPPTQPQLLDIWNRLDETDRTKLLGFALGLDAARARPALPASKRERERERERESKKRAK